MSSTDKRLAANLARILDAKLYRDPRLKEALIQLRLWMGPNRHERPEGYLNVDKYFYAYIAYYLPLHLPELFWILDQATKKTFDLSATSVLDVGCGPGTLTLALLLWLEQNNRKPPGDIELWDQSSKALKVAREKVNLISDPLQTRVFTDKVKLPRFPLIKKRFDVILFGHFFVEWGSGPRFREKKLNFLISLLDRYLAENGTCIIVEPPLREPTLDLMYLRDQLMNDMQIIVPCPQSTKGCPMLKDNLGWCYAQPERREFRERGLTPLDHKLEKMLDIHLSHPGFSYMVFTRKKHVLPLTEVFVSDDRGPKTLICEPKGKISTDKSVVPHRGYIHHLSK